MEERKSLSVFCIFPSEKPLIFKYSTSKGMMLQCEHEHQHLEQDFLWKRLLCCEAVNSRMKAVQSTAVHVHDSQSVRSDLGHTSLDCTNLVLAQTSEEHVRSLQTLCQTVTVGTKAQVQREPTIGNGTRPK